jgi:hypothetical protein
VHRTGLRLVSYKVEALNASLTIILRALVNRTHTILIPFVAGKSDLLSCHTIKELKGATN